MKLKKFLGGAALLGAFAAASAGFAQAATEASAAPVSNGNSTVAVQASATKDAPTFTGSNGKKYKVELTGLCGGNNGGYHPGIPNGQAAYGPHGWLGRQAPPPPPPAQ